MTEEELTRLEGLANAATDGPWTKSGAIIPDNAPIIYSEDAERVICSLFYQVDTRSDYGAYDNIDANQNFIAASRQAVPSLIAEVRRLREQSNKPAHIHHPSMIHHNAQIVLLMARIKNYEMALEFIASGCLVQPDGGSPCFQDAIDTARAALKQDGDLNDR